MAEKVALQPLLRSCPMKMLPDGDERTMAEWTRGQHHFRAAVLRWDRVSRSGLWQIAEKIVIGGARFGFALEKIGGVAIEVERHVAGVEANDSIGMGSAMFQETGDSLCLGGCECAKDNAESGVKGTIGAVQACGAYWRPL
jgi:hypothetical protein